MKPFANIINQNELDVCPNIIGATINPTWEQLKEDGYRQLVSEDNVPEGYRATGWRYDDINGETCNKTLVSSVNIAEEEAREAEERRLAEIARQLAKSLVLKTCENNFLILCDQLSGGTSHAKLGFDTLRAIILQLPIDQQLVISVQLLSIDSELKREGGNLWWDDCIWHSEII